VATILERSVHSTIASWLERVERDEKLTIISLNYDQRTGHLPRLLQDLVTRLRSFRPLGSKAMASDAAHEHGALRRNQGYSAAMIVEESRMLQVSIFETLQANLANIDFSLLLNGVMTIADEWSRNSAKQWRVISQNQLVMHNLHDLLPLMDQVRPQGT
jgi:hypothetical protein